VLCHHIRSRVAAHHGPDTFADLVMSGRLDQGRPWSLQAVFAAPPFAKQARRTKSTGTAGRFPPDAPSVLTGGSQHGRCNT